MGVGEEGNWELGVRGWGRRGWGDGEMGRWGEEEGGWGRRGWGDGEMGGGRRELGVRSWGLGKKRVGGWG
uniref:Uncharacterized protein n=1 Tax=Desertifilum tharense IPPAS B-1220 TaxID=1781255 RepID=A0ACD5H110_9CYAN